jgi:hypothetical protein
MGWRPQILGLQALRSAEEDSMECTAVAPLTAGTRQSIERAVCKAFLTAHVLTGSTEQAESAAIEAIDSWHPDNETEEVLFGNVLRAAARANIQRKPKQSGDPEAGASYLPSELQAVLRLAHEPRCCFVLRFLAGLPRQVCARLLDLHSDQVDQYTCAGLTSLAEPNRRPAAVVKHSANAGIVLPAA